MVWEVVVPARNCAWWYLRFSLSLRDVEELMAERGLSVNHNTVWRWTQNYAPEVRRRCEGRSSRKGRLCRK
jgi:transposase-like protein